MAGSFSGIEIARRSLDAHRTALDVTGHNIANANTPGYSRQIASMSPTRAYPVPGYGSPNTAGQVGTGVEVTRIERMKDSFIEERIWEENQVTGRWSEREDALEQIELIFNEPSESGIRSAMDQYWEALQELTKRPDDLAARAVVAERASVLADTLQQTRLQLTQYQSDLDRSVMVKVREVNSLATQIADLNDQIARITVSGGRPNDLYDQRDLLVARLSRLVDADVSTGSQGMINIALGGVSLVSGNRASQLRAEPDGDRAGRVSIEWEWTGEQAVITNGELKGILEIRDQDLNYYITALDSMALTLIEETNRVHREGYGLDGFNGRNFWEPVDTSVEPPYGQAAARIRVSDEIRSDLNKIAASASGLPGDGSNALRLAELKQARLVDGTATLSDEYASLIASLGVASQEAKTMVDNQETLLNHLEDLGGAVSGVSLDEEVANMIQYQHAYNAAARLMTTMDEMLDVLINRTGIVGR